MKLKKTLARWLTNRYQLIIRSEEDFGEKSSFRFNYAQLIILSFVSFVTLVIFSLLLANTILAKWLNPRYIEQTNEKKIIHLSLSVDSLEQQVIKQDKFIKLIQSVIEGKPAPTYEVTTADPSKKNTLDESLELENLVEVDSLLHSEFEEKGPSLLSTCNRPISDLKELFFFPPITGIITAPFNSKIEHYGVDIVAKDKEPIKCISDGVVIFSSWTVEGGWIIAIQHSKNLVSIYKHNSALLKKVGNFVQAGDIISIMGNSGELTTGPHLHFELWYEGVPVNPEDFIPF
ncbi:MAG: M23 family metallopeptidase [Cytophagales bacterium]|nr:M23 family metallopeptidase [Cytophagales bacterium]